MPTELTFFLAKVLGLGCLIFGAALLVRRHYYVAVFADLAEQRMTRMAIAIFELFAALSLVIGHNVWSPLPAAIISLIGWLAIVEASIYLLLPDAAIRRMLSGFSSPGSYFALGAITIVLGGYLAGFGFGWW